MALIVQRFAPPSAVSYAESAFATQANWYTITNVLKRNTNRFMEDSRGRVRIVNLATKISNQTDAWEPVIHRKFTASQYSSTNVSIILQHPPSCGALLLPYCVFRKTILKLLSSVKQFSCLNNRFQVSPCNCAGTLGVTHEGCLNEWIATSGRNYCEICKRRYIVSGYSLAPVCKWQRPALTLEV